MIVNSATVECIIERVVSPLEYYFPTCYKMLNLGADGSSSRHPLEAVLWDQAKHEAEFKAYAALISGSQTMVKVWAYTAWYSVVILHP